MKLLSGLLSLITVLLAVSFALANRQTTTLSFWPFDMVLEAPLFLLTLGTLFAGVLLGGGIAWFNNLATHFEARRLKKELAVLQKRMTATPTITGPSTSLTPFRPRPRFMPRFLEPKL